ncbi:MAG: type III-A CRISPR-associated protein Cas10/Csm1 [Gammaproteobacteria bacterium]|nr:MAG: type III-A CRISPR-associated protein Cas10/Csm1 [Gammaproteobacteria bacterium]
MTKNLNQYYKMTFLNTEKYLKKLCLYFELEPTKTTELLTKIPRVKNQDNENYQNIYQQSLKISTGDKNINDDNNKFLTSIFSKIHHQNTGDYVYKPTELTANCIFPTTQQETNYDNELLKNNLITDFNNINNFDAKNPDLWLNDFISFFEKYASNLPSSQNNVSLFDEYKITTAFCAALIENIQKDKNNLLYIQGDLFAIQDFIFKDGAQSTKNAAKILRGRSFYVSLLSELAVIKILQQLQLPPTSLLLSVAGKFNIIAPNTEDNKKIIAEVKEELNQWFIKHTFGQNSLGIATTETSIDDFFTDNLQNLQDKIRKNLEIQKFQRFNLSNTNQSPVYQDYLNSFDKNMGLCDIDGQTPATSQQDSLNLCDLAQDHINIGKWLTNNKFITITEKNNNSKNKLLLPIFGFYVSFANKTDNINNTIIRWDLSSKFTGISTIKINSYIPIWNSKNIPKTQLEKDRYKTISDDKNDIHLGMPKTFSHLACEDQKYHKNQNKYLGQKALIALKGDIDDLGLLFQQGIENMNLGIMFATSRLLNNFWTIYLPDLCQKEFPNTYTVFAGGDDFFLIGPWHSQIKLTSRLEQDFKRFVCHNKKIHFSVGLSMTQPNMPIKQLAQMAEQSLEKAKNYNLTKKNLDPKNAITCFDETMKWDEFNDLTQQKLPALQNLITGFDGNLSTGYVYRLLHLIDMQNKVKENPENSIWQAYFAYRTHRLLELQKHLTNDEKQKLAQDMAEIIAKNIEKHSQNYKIVLFTHLYQQRS